MVPVAQETTANTVRLPYSFSRRFSLVAWCEASLEILHVHPLSLSVLQELQRGLNASFTLRQIDEAEFEQRLNAVWQRDSSEARQLMEDLGSAEDFFTLAEELPETEDLLESDDDAPIIKLINAMLAEAIKEGASDIHIETFEKSLVIRFRVDGTRWQESWSSGQAIPVAVRMTLHSPQWGEIERIWLLRGPQLS